MVLKHIKRLPKRRFAYVTLQNSRISDETIFSGHKSFKFPAQRGIVIYLGTFSHSKLVSGHTTSLMSKPCSSLIHHGRRQWKWKWTLDTGGYKSDIILLFSLSEHDCIGRGGKRAGLEPHHQQHVRR